MSANEKQIGGDHYKSDIQHWDYVLANELDYFQAQITKYVSRWKKKGGVADLKKALHFLEKYIETEEAKLKLSAPFLQGGGGGGLGCAALKKMVSHPFGYDPKTEL